MKKYLVVAALGFMMCSYAHAQVTCIFCYEQNAPISTPVNNLLLNGSFENGCNLGGQICPNSSLYSCDITNWTCTGGGINTYALTANFSYSVIVDGIRAVYFGNGFCEVCPSGDTSCINNINCIVSGIPIGYPISGPTLGGDTGVSLQQTVTGLVTGNTYVLEFWAGGEGTFSIGANGLFAVDVGFGNIMLRDKPTPVTGDIGTRYIIEFIATSSSHTIKFTNWGHICGDCTELVLDDVRLYTIAELSETVPPCTVGINESTKNTSATVYPNPFTTQLNIALANNESSQLILYDIASRKLLQQSFTNSVSINTTSLESGIYFYEVSSGNKMMRNGKVVKE